MDRKNFIRQCGMACLAGSAITLLFDSCSGTRIITANVEGDSLVVDPAEFLTKQNEKKFRQLLVISNSRLKYPICLYKHSETEYSALLMQCTHQGSELTAFGDKLYCASHGSEFNNHGVVVQGPAATSLRSFPVRLENNQIKIALR